MAKQTTSEKNLRSEKSSTASDCTANSEQALTFEQAMSELQQIVNDLEDNSLGLEASLAQFERGIGLLRNL